MPYIEQNKQAFLAGKLELEFAVEGKYTNLRVWCGHDGPQSHKHLIDTVFMRLDRANHYSAPLQPDSYKYLEKPNLIIRGLAYKFGFKSPISDAEEILSSLQTLNHRACIAW